MRKKQNSNQITMAKHTISARLPAKQHSTNLQQNSLETLVQQGTVAIVATTIAKPISLALTLFSFCLFHVFVYYLYC
jgi:hypothetical protein